MLHLHTFHSKTMLTIYASIKLKSQIANRHARKPHTELSLTTTPIKQSFYCLYYLYSTSWRQKEEIKREKSTLFVLVLYYNDYSVLDSQYGSHTVRLCHLEVGECLDKNIWTNFLIKFNTCSVLRL